MWKQTTEGIRMYQIIGSDGEEYGPVSLDEFKAWAAQGRVTAATKVRPVAGGEWVPAGHVPELNAALGAGAVPPRTPPPAGIPVNASRPPSTGLAITSLVLGLGILACLAPLTSVPAIICGHIAYARARRAPDRYGGSGFAVAGFVLGYVGLVFSIPILAALLLPALSRAKGRAESITCANNLEMIGLAFKTWGIDHQDQFSFNVSTNSGGTREWVQVSADATVHFQVASNELSTPRVLRCPADRSLVPALNFSTLSASNISYVLHTGPNIDRQHPEAVLIECPIHHHLLRADGSLQEGLRVTPVVRR